MTFYIVVLSRYIMTYSFKYVVLDLIDSFSDLNYVDDVSFMYENYRISGVKFIHAK
jgi:hypothetical protein